ncbi:MAG: hypothetical protein ABFS45_19795 [Pseudomonadota bacterium]
MGSNNTRQGNFFKSMACPGTRCLLLIVAALAPHVGLSATGQEIFESRCDKCHAQPDPHNYTADQWVKRLTSMISIAQLTPEEYESVLAYLQDNAGTEETALQEERQAFDKSCRSCHATLDPAPVAWRGKRLEDRLLKHYEVLEEAGKVEEELDEDLAHEAAEYLLFSHEFNWILTTSSPDL